MMNGKQMLTTVWVDHDFKGARDMKKIIAFGFGLLLIGLSNSFASSGHQANSEPVSQTKEYKYKCIRSGQIHTYTRPGNYKCPEHPNHNLIPTK
jgi:hypothetical protein